ncbi:fatty acid desaturase-domain-containing protein [Irpex rosettiformis]|uniref:Fatty acid desaturase-domain-containing protein n=1 Tax=Irpex rosettiformis TaxID=378272 RepID=A0ACB8U0B1_9APHY|nr:fatty acid desaturase-domain-containing protein [Irpex rosettiformis]
MQHTTSSEPHNASSEAEVECVETYTPLTWTIQEIRDAIPAKFHERDTAISMQYLCRDLAMMLGLFIMAVRIDPWFQLLADKTAGGELTTRIALEVGHWVAWSAYWWFQGLVITGIWVIGHDCGHGAFSSNQVVCDAIGFILHSAIFTPFFSWRISHHRHHMNHNSMERDEVYVPMTRGDLGIPNRAREEIDWEEYFGDTPLYTLYMLVRQQLLAFPAYLLFNVSGQKSYPWPTNHFDPSSILFSKSQRHLVIMSNIGMILAGCCLGYACNKWGSITVFKYYGIPWLFLNHWFVMITYLHHTDPTIPHYRGKAWSYARGAASTVDRNFLGWQGLFFLHGVAHYHVVHHFFPKMPHYHGAEATKYLKTFLGEHYHHSDKPAFSALWHNYNACQFVEDDGDVLFYRNKEGKSVVRPSS